MTRKVRSEISELDRFGIGVRPYRSYVNLHPDPHAIDVLLVSFIARGQARHLIQDAAFEAGPGSVGITRPGETHSVVTDRDGVRIYNIFLDPVRHLLPLVPPALRTVQQVLFPQHEGFHTRLNRAVHFQVPDPESFEHCVQLIAAESRGAELGSEQIVAALREVFVVTCCRAAQDSGIEPAQAEGESVPSWVIALCRRLDDSYAHAVSLDELCTSTGFSKGYLCRAFKRHVGVTIGDYLIQRRLQAAMQALRGGSDKVLAIALDAGFNDLSHFNRSFKAQVGMTPTAYRRGA